MTTKSASQCGRKPRTVPTYLGPSREEVNAFTDAKVLEELARLKVEPHKLHHMENDEILIVAHGENDYDHEWTKAEIQELRQEVNAWHHDCLKTQLLSAYIASWIATLSEGECWKIVEELEARKVALSEKRYTSRDELRARTGWAVYAIVHNQSTTKGGSMN